MAKILPVVMPQSQLVSAAMRVFSVVERLSETRSIGLDELSRELGLAKATVYRFLQTLQELGYVRREQDESWALTLKMFTVGSRALTRLDMIEVARPLCFGLGEALGESVQMGVLDAGSVVFVIKVDSQHTVCTHTKVGRRIPLHCTAMGKVLLAHKEAGEVDDLLGSRPLFAETPHTIVDHELLRQELAAIRAAGVAHDREEHEVGVHCISAPVFDHSGAVVAAISASWPAFRYALTDSEAATTKIVATARRISQYLGSE